MARQPWQDDDWVKTFIKALDRRGMTQRAYAKKYGVSNSEVSRIVKCEGSLPAVLQACQVLGLAPPPGIFSPVHLRVLRAVESLISNLERRYPDGDSRQVIETMVAAFVAQIEADAKRLGGS